MSGKGHRPGDHSTSSSNTSLNRNNPTRQSLRKRILERIRPGRHHSTSEGDAGAATAAYTEPESNKRSWYSPRAAQSSKHLSASRSSSDSSTTHVSGEYQPFPNSKSKTASLDRVLARRVPEEEEEERGQDVAGNDLPVRRLTRSRSMRERTGKMLSAVRQRVRPHGHGALSETPAATAPTVARNRNRGAAVADGPAGKLEKGGKSSGDLEKIAATPDVSNTSGDQLVRKSAAQQSRDSAASGNDFVLCPLDSSNATISGTVISRTGEEFVRSSRSVQDNLVTALANVRTIPTSEALASSPHSYANSMSRPQGNGSHSVAGFIKGKWRSRPKLIGSSQNSELYLWSPAKGECEWQSLSGRSLTLVNTDISTLSEAERYMLQKVALDEVTQLNLSAHIAIPREDGTQPLRRGLSFRTRSKVSVNDTNDGKGGASNTGAVFGILLSQVIHNDATMRKQPLSASTPLSDKVKDSPSSSGLDSNDQSAINSSSESLESFLRSPEPATLDKILHPMRFPPRPQHSPPLPFALPSGEDGDFTPKTVACRTVSLPVKGGSDYATTKADHQPSARASMVTQPLILEDDIESPSLPSRTYSVGTSPSMYHTKPPFLGMKVRSHGQVTPSSCVDDRNDMQAHMHTPLASLTDSSGRSYSVDRLLDALVLDDATSPSSTEPRKKSKHHAQQHDKQCSAYELLSPQPPRVPVLVTAAIDFLTQHGLHEVGLFRKAGARKRCRQIQEEFDFGYEIQFSKNDHHVNDVASVLKNFFRDLPEPLLSRTLYRSFLSVTKFDSKERQLHAIRLLCCLLPAANRDTLRVLLRFLYLVAQHSQDREGADGAKIPGNKMDISNLALIIGPNILRREKAKPGYNVAKQRQFEKDEGKNHYIMMLMIEHHELIFRVTKQLHHRVMLLLQVKKPSVVDHLLKRKCYDMGLVLSKEELIEELRPDRRNMLRDKRRPKPADLDRSVASELVRSREGDSKDDDHRSPESTPPASPEPSPEDDVPNTEMSASVPEPGAVLLQEDTVPPSTRLYAASESPCAQINELPSSNNNHDCDVYENNSRNKQQQKHLSNGCSNRPSHRTSGSDLNAVCDTSAGDYSPSHRSNMSVLPPDAMLGSTKVRAPSSSSPRRNPYLRRSSSARSRLQPSGDSRMSLMSSIGRLRRKMSLNDHDRINPAVQVIPLSLSSGAPPVVSPAATVTASSPINISPAISSGEVTPTVIGSGSLHNMLDIGSSDDEGLTKTLANGDSTPASVATGSESLLSRTSDGSFAESFEDDKAQSNTTVHANTPATDSSAGANSSGANDLLQDTSRSSIMNRRSSSPLLLVSRRLSSNRYVRSGENGRVFRLLCYFEALAEEKRVHEQSEEEARQKRLVSPLASRRSSQATAGSTSVSTSSSTSSFVPTSGAGGGGTPTIPRRTVDRARRTSSTGTAAPTPATPSSSTASSAFQSRSASFSIQLQDSNSQVSPMASSSRSELTADSGCSACTSGASLDSNVDLGSDISPPTGETNECAEDDDEGDVVLTAGRDLVQSSVGIDITSHGKHASESGMESSSYTSLVDERHASLSGYVSGHCSLRARTPVNNSQDDEVCNSKHVHNLPLGRRTSSPLVPTTVVVGGQVEEENKDADETDV